MVTRIFSCMSFFELCCRDQWLAERFWGLERPQTHSPLNVDGCFGWHLETQRRVSCLARLRINRVCSKVAVAVLQLVFNVFTVMLSTMFAFRDRHEWRWPRHRLVAPSEYYVAKGLQILCVLLVRVANPWGTLLGHRWTSGDLLQLTRNGLVWFVGKRLRFCLVTPLALSRILSSSKIRSYRDRSSAIRLYSLILSFCLRCLLRKQPSCSCCTKPCKSCTRSAGTRLLESCPWASSAVYLSIVSSARGSFLKSAGNHNDLIPPFSSFSRPPSGAFNSSSWTLVSIPLNHSWSSLDP